MVPVRVGDFKMGGHGPRAGSCTDQDGKFSPRKVGLLTVVGTDAALDVCRLSHDGIVRGSSGRCQRLLLHQELPLAIAAGVGQGVQFHPSFDRDALPGHGQQACGIWDLHISRSTRAYSETVWSIGLRDGVGWYFGGSRSIGSGGDQTI